MKQTNNSKLPKKAGWINEFLWSCAGVDKPILRQCPPDYSKFAGIGGMILFTAIMAAISGGYALNFVFDNIYLAISFGVFWGLLIFNLDRFIVNTMYSDGKYTISWAEIRSGLPRIIMAIFLGIVISTPLEMKIFDDQIQAQLELDNAKRTAKATEANHALYDKLDKYKTEKSKIEARLTELSDELGKAQEDRRKEAEGSALSGLAGMGDIYKAKNQYVIDCQNRLNQYKAEHETDLERLNKEIAVAKEEIDRKQEVINKSVNQDRFAARYEAFENVTSWDEHPELAIVSLMITLLFVVIETAPTFLKMMMEDGPYDDLLRAEKHKAKILADKEISDVNDEVNTAVRISTMKNEKRLEAETIANQDILEKIARAQAELLETAISGWKETELEKIHQNPSAYIVSAVSPEQNGAVMYDAPEIQEEPQSSQDAEAGEDSAEETGSPEAESPRIS